MKPRCWNVLVAEPAKRDIARIVDYIARELCNPTAAAKHLDSFDEAVQGLRSRPAMLPEVPLSPWRERGYHVKTVRNYLLVFRVDAADRNVFVTRVFHATQDWLAHLESLA